ncbi:H/ACA ribonucleoprotein complex non-core subunit NAF1 [Lucilia sericata]|uniref:H/ACA ribonucleoprotein complex non-core subunit NAF1 n=1 Tax=Lucilia sericata TaxID=13632 RepID=UPI0018A82901|nr:H/ACA ribonucleoprotein complex non-core subunit NAF1 [Lucilia sericata]
MDTNDSENLKNESTSTEEQSHRPVEPQVTTDTNGAEIKEEETTATTKETIEILQVELIAPRTEEAVDTKIANEKTNNISHVEECSEKKQTPQEQATTIQNESVAETKSTSNEMETSDENIQTSETNEANTEETTFNTLESSNQQPTTSGLGLLAQYDSDNESVVEVPIDQDYRNQVVEIDSDSDSDDSSDSSDVEYLSELRKTIEKRMEVVDDDDDEDEDSNTGKRKNTPRLKVKGEMLLEDLPPIQDLQITVPEDECIEFGKIHSVVDQLLLVSALPNSILLDLGTVIFLEKGQKVLGEVFDVLGQVADPLYCVRFNSNKQIKEKQINVGDVVYVAPKTQYTQYVILSNLMKIKGSDASWENDVEPPPRFLDYSDDEQEQLARRQLRNKDRPMDNDDPTKKPRTMEDEDASTNRYQQSNNSQRGRYNEQRNNNRGGGNNRPRYNAPPHHNQQRTPNPNHHRSSWHSNYYPQSYPHQPSTANYGMPPVHNQPPPSQAYLPHVPMYGMPPMHNMPYPPPTQPAQYGAPPMLHQHNPQLMPNTFSIRPPTLHGPPPPHMAHHQQYSSTPPPPPGSQ